MAQLIRQALELIGFEVIVVPQDVIMRRAAGALKLEVNDVTTLSYLFA